MKRVSFSVSEVLLFIIMIFIILAYFTGWDVNISDNF